jgi:peptide/nickel transport system ATP-binding protein
MSEPVLKVSELTIEFLVDGQWYPAAINMNFEVDAGKVLAIVGESG